MERTWRWFGKNDKITLAMLKQIGVEGIVTALHDVPLGQVWTREKIRDLREYIESYGMRWSVVESLPVVGTTKLHHIEGAAKAVDLHLTDEEIAYLEEPYAPHPLAGVMPRTRPQTPRKSTSGPPGARKFNGTL